MFKKFAKYMPMGGFPDKRGYALQASISTDSRERIRFFVEMAPQTKPKPKSGSTESPFDWKLKKYISLDAAEMGNLLACLRGRLQNVKIVHKFPMDAPPTEQKITGLEVKKGEYNGLPNWGVSLTQKVGTEKPETYQLYLSAGEVEIIMAFLSSAIAQSYEL
jgi:hypothetical protein